MIQDKSYDDIIDIQYPVKTDRLRMSLHDRASQFAPFAALTGYEELIGETVRHNDEAMENGTDE